MDMQSRAFREASFTDWSAVTGLERVPDAQRIVAPDEWDALRWDGARGVPKGVDEARQALAARVADPQAPDDDSSVYDANDPGGARTAGRPLGAGSVWVPWLPDAARSAGLPVVLVPGWASRGHGGMRVVEGVVGHHTATSDAAKGDYPSLNVVTNGRAGLAGPLCNLGLGRNGTVYVVAAGCAYHAGASRWAGFTDLNDEFLGIEAEDNGDGKWTAQQLDAYPRLVAGLLRYMRRGADRYISHRGCALPTGRKPDPAGIADDWMRQRAGALLAGPTPAPPTERKGENMIENVAVPPGKGAVRRVVPVGEASSITARAWVSLVANGPRGGSARVFFQSDRGGISHADLSVTFRDGWSSRPWAELPSGTTQVNMTYDLPDGGVFAVETQSR
jgi:hypothetical protein